MRGSTCGSRDRTILSFVWGCLVRRTSMALTTSASDKNLVALLQQDLARAQPPTPPADHPSVGFVGLGAMGYPIAKNLATYHHASPPLLVWNRSRARSDNLLAELGPRVRIADSLEQIALECDLIFTSLGSDEAVKEVYSTFYTALKVR